LKKITIFNTSICTENIGDFIIMDAVKEQLYELFSEDMIFETITQDKISKATYKLVKNSNYSFVGGTNLLSSNMQRYNQWKINLYDAFYLKDILLMGVGWWQYQDKPSFYTKYLFNSVLSHDVLHSVRDAYTEKKLIEMGFDNVINTGCPTMWNLTKEHCLEIPHQKAESVVFTLTDYNQDKKRDQQLIGILHKNYKKLYFWPQGSRDLAYIHRLANIENIQIIGGNLISYNNLLDNQNIELDFVGTRLHAGIRSLQKKRRTIIIGIDNRAEEKSKDFNLKVISREKLDLLEDIIQSDLETKITLNEENIKRWKNQFL